MFGARGPCLEGADGTGSGALPPAPAPAGDPTPAPVPAPAPAPAEVAFTPEQQAVINKLVGQARQEGRNAAKPPAPAPAPIVPSAPEPKLTLEDIARELAETKMRARFDKQALRRGFSDDTTDDLFDLYKAHKPTDDETWFTEREKRLVLKQAATPPGTQNPAPLPVVPNTAPLSDRGSPAPNGAVGWRYELNNPIGMSTAARAQMDAELGVDKARKMRLEAARGQASTMKVAFGPKG
jgi:hypothetical protein